MRWGWWPVKTVRELLQQQIDELDAWARIHVATPHAQRDGKWHADMDELLARRGALMVQRNLGFMITDRRRVRG